VLRLLLCLAWCLGLAHGADLVGTALAGDGPSRVQHAAALPGPALAPAVESVLGAAPLAELPPSKEGRSNRLLFPARLARPRDVDLRAELRRERPWRPAPRRPDANPDDG